MGRMITSHIAPLLMAWTHRSTTQKMLVTTFFVMTFWLVAWLVLTPLGLDVPPFDSTSASLWFGTIATLYGARRYTKAKHESIKEITD